MKLNRPTVADMVAALDKFPRDAPFRVEDGSTNWDVMSLSIERDEDGIVRITYGYEDARRQQRR